MDHYDRTRISRLVGFPRGCPGGESLARFLTFASVRVSPKHFSRLLPVRAAVRVSRTRGLADG